MFHDVKDRIFENVAISDLPKVAKDLLKEAMGCRVWLFNGEMGAGKTTLIKELCNTLGVVDNMSSPTFSIVNEYATLSHETIYHFDFYRIKNEAEAYDIGTEEYFDSGNYCFIEWPEKIPSLIPQNHVEVNITTQSETLRTIALSVHDGQEKNRI
ncbi:tRNA (adenosine(37)-N6)-threonylcarbamoyltransferase complex ATPase subunit type 1 TsaE [Chryseosolibacter indicus]|uniref:tRNA threonylcarbamoyladenosine biosynthesis protein TsaE n=1 Tax=Chryseosolibacter indicus TaxID=2782351 RepID=A0ABS5VN45_9BACT|nr:tRNA (adenosine(37)-N6)-threonylcarbamoyltransferase complex ATPase subunit type 1 TsaE [Chryseosolibacter indicus]MBT1702443.1 tRNA (adenosine(37)-N6)-threonylcarbamoyltransferase complex ATPase subunit type 1 TsaE [Chryseosolibacter indicus]